MKKRKETRKRPGGAQEEAASKAAPGGLKLASTEQPLGMPKPLDLSSPVVFLRSLHLCEVKLIPPLTSILFE